MSMVMAGIAAMGVVTSMIGASKQANATREQGQDAKERGQEQRSYNAIAASEVMAIGRINAAEDRRQAKLIASRAVAVAAAGGAVEDIDYLLADIYGEGAYRASVSLMTAQSESNRLLWEGDQAAKHGADLFSASKGRAQGVMLTGFGSALQTGARLYGSGSFGGSSTPGVGSADPYFRGPR